MINMKSALLTLAAISCLLLTPSLSAQVAIGVNIGPAPVCPYGYFADPPYTCAPYGYYGPEWFVGGVFIGAGPWFHGPAHFFGHVDNRFDPRFGYHGPFPEHGDVRFNHFHPNEMRDAHGHLPPPRR